MVLNLYVHLFICFISFNWNCFYNLRWWKVLFLLVLLFFLIFVAVLFVSFVCDFFVCFLVLFRFGFCCCYFNNIYYHFVLLICRFHYIGYSSYYNQLECSLSENACLFLKMSMFTYYNLLLYFLIIITKNANYNDYV